MTDEEFGDFLDACRNELAEKQQGFQSLLSSDATWRYDLDDCSIVLGDKSFEFVPVGTYSQEHQSWLWAWANESFPPAARQSSERIKQLHEITGFRVFLNPGFSATSLEAQDLSAMAIHLLGGIGLFRAANEGTLLYLAIRPSSRP